MKIKVALLMGGDSAEREVSIMSSEEMMRNLDKNKYDVVPITISGAGNFEWIIRLMDEKPDVALSGLHGGLGEDGSVQGLLNCLNIPYAGSKVMASAICMDKAMSKFIMRAANIPCADDILLKRGEDIYFYRDAAARMGYPLVVKPNQGGSSIGVSIVNDFEGLRAAARIEEYGDMMVEKFVSGQEVTCGILETKDGLEVLTVLDIDADERDPFYDYNAKYFNEMTKIEFSKQPEFMQVMIREIAKKVYNVTGCSGYARVDMIVSGEQVFVLEMNTLPGLTSHSLIPKAAIGKGMGFPEFLDKLIDTELSRRKATP